MKIKRKSILRVFVILFVFIKGTLLFMTGPLLAKKEQFDFASKSSNKTAPAPTSGARNAPELYKSKGSNQTAPTEKLYPDLFSNGSSKKLKKHKK